MERNRIIVCEDCHMAIHLGIGRDSRKGVKGSRCKRRQYPIGNSNSKYVKNKKQAERHLAIRKKIEDLQNSLK